MSDCCRGCRPCLPWSTPARRVAFSTSWPPASSGGPARMNRPWGATTVSTCLPLALPDTAGSWPDSEMWSVPIRNALTIDVEDYYHVTGFEGCVDRADWGRLESRVVASTHRVLDLLRRHE